MAEPLATGPTLEQGQTIRTMRDDLQRLRSGQMPSSIPSIPPPSLIIREAPLDQQEDALGNSFDEETMLTPQEPFTPSESLSPLKPGDFDLLSHLSGTAQTPQTPDQPRPPQIVASSMEPPQQIPIPNIPTLPPKPPPPPSFTMPPGEIEKISPEKLFGNVSVDLLQTPESPLRPEELLALEEETLQESGGRFPALHIPRVALLGIAGLIVLGGISGAAYFFFLRSHKTTTSPPPPAATTEPSPAATEAPKPLLPIPATTRSIASIEEARVELHELFAQRDTSGTLRALAIKLENAQETRYLSLSDIAAALDITFPENVLASVNSNSFTLFLFNNPEDGSTRAGLAFQVTDANALAQAMAQWEAAMPSDLDPLLLSLGKTEEPDDLRFKTTVRKGLTNHYLNFPGPATSVDYTVDPSRKIMLLATSRDTMYAAIDSLTGNAE